MAERFVTTTGRLLARRKWSALLLGACAVAILGSRPHETLSAAWAESPESPVPANTGEAGVREDALLRHLCRYLRLSRTQVLHLVPFARHTRRGRDLLERECEERRRVFESLAATQPEASERLRQEMEQRRAQVLAELTAVGARGLIRNLTREQIALAWRLSQGNPPRYARADPALLDPAAGFVQRASYRLKGGETLLRLDDRLHVQADAGRVADFDLATELETARLAIEEQRLRPQLSPPGGEQGMDPRPFPQLVAETNNPDDLLPALRPLAGRLFFSDRWLPVLEEILRSGESPAGSARPAAPGPLRLLRDFRMERGFRDVAGRGTELEPLGGNLDHGLYVFDPGQGLRVPDAGVTDHYALQLNLIYRGGDGYQKILDFKDRASDGGLYFFRGRLTFYTLATGGTPAPDVEHRLRVERDRTTRIVRVSLDLRPIFAFIDLDDEAVFEKGRTALFVDDKTTNNEQGAGALRSLSVWGPAPPREP